MKKKIILSMLALSIITLTPSTIKAAETVELTQFEHYQPGEMTAVQPNPEDSTVTIDVKGETKTIESERIVSIGLKKLDSKKYKESNEEKESEKDLYVLTNNFSDECDYIPVYSAEKNGEKLDFSLFGSFKDNEVIVDTEIIKVISENYQENFSLSEDSVSETGTAYDKFILPDGKDFNIDEGYELKYYEYNKDMSAEGTSDETDFKAVILPEDKNKIKQVKFYVLDEDGEYKLIKTEDVEVGKSATAPKESNWDKDFSNVTDNMDVYESKEEFSEKSSDNKDDDNNDDEDVVNRTQSLVSENKSVSENTINVDDGKTATNAQTGDASTLPLLLSVFGASGTGLGLFIKKKRK